MGRQNILKKCLLANSFQNFIISFIFHKYLKMSFTQLFYRAILCKQTSFSSFPNLMRVLIDLICPSCASLSINLSSDFLSSLVEMPSLFSISMIFCKKRCFLLYQLFGAAPIEIRPWLFDLQLCKSFSEHIFAVGREKHKMIQGFH